MPRVKKGITKHARHEKILEMSKGFFGRAKNCYSIAVNKVKCGLQSSYVDRKDLKGGMRSTWIQRLNAICRSKGLIYSKFINKLKIHNIPLNRKVLSELAIRDQKAFSQLIQKLAN